MIQRPFVATRSMDVDAASCSVSLESGAPTRHTAYDLRRLDESYRTQVSSLLPEQYSRTRRLASSSPSPLRRRALPGGQRLSQRHRCHRPHDMSPCILDAPIILAVFPRRSVVDILTCRRAASPQADATCSDLMSHTIPMAARCQQRLIRCVSSCMSFFLLLVTGIAFIRMQDSEKQRAFIADAALAVARVLE